MGSSFGAVRRLAASAAGGDPAEVHANCSSRASAPANGSDRGSMPHMMPANAGRPPGHKQGIPRCWVKAGSGSATDAEVILGAVEE
jgi:hypothetical protein